MIQLVGEAGRAYFQYTCEHCSWMEVNFVTRPTGKHLCVRRDGTMHRVSEHSDVTIGPRP